MVLNSFVLATLAVFFDSNPLKRLEFFIYILSRQSAQKEDELESSTQNIHLLVTPAPVMIGSRSEVVAYSLSPFSNSLPLVSINISSCLQRVMDDWIMHLGNYQTHKF